MHITARYYSTDLDRKTNVALNRFFQFENILIIKSNHYQHEQVG